MSFHLRPYQSDCLESIRFGHQEHNAICVELATGLGKTVIFTRYAAMHREYAPERNRVMVIAPQITLVSQAAAKLQKETGEWPEIEQGDNWSNEGQYRGDFVVASKQSLASNDRYKRFQDIGLVIIDECHYAATESYAQILKHFTDGGAQVLGVSATLRRHDNRAMGQLFEECVFQYGISDAISEGWLVPIKATVKQLDKLDLSKVETGITQFGKDFNQKQLSEKLENPEVIYEIAEATAEETRGQKTVLFCASVEEARAVSDLLNDQHKIKSAWICADGRCPKQQRQEAMESFTKGDVTHLANVGILTTGWDFPQLENIIMARPTRSKPLFTQMLGRVTRPLEGVVDFEGSTSITRQEAIRTSSKPVGRVIDLVDNSLSHKIVTAGDVLGGRWSLLSDEQIICRFCREEFSSRVLLSVHVSEEHAEEAMEAQAKDAEEIRAENKALEKALREQRARVKAEAKFRDQQVNVFGGAQAAAKCASIPKEMMSDKQKRYLWVLGAKWIDDAVCSKATAGRMIGQFQRGMSADEVYRLNARAIKWRREVGV